MTFEMVPKGIKFARAKSANFMPKGAIFQKKCKKVLFNSYVVMQFSQLARKHNFCEKNSVPCFMNY